jgi:hypothetical protein
MLLRLFFVLVLSVLVSGYCSICEDNRCHSATCSRELTSGYACSLNRSGESNHYYLTSEVQDGKYMVTAFAEEGTSQGKTFHFKCRVGQCFYLVMGWIDTYCAFNFTICEKEGCQMCTEDNRCKLD